MFLHIPIYDTNYQFELYKIYNIPTFNSNASHGLRYEDLPENVAISTDQEIFLELTSQELERCTEVTNRRICPVIRASRRVLTTRSCVMSLFKNDPSKKELCTQVLTPWEGFYRFYSFYLGNRKWLYFDSQEKVVTYTCPDTRFRGTDTRSINKISILEVP